jgi:hypothetical protein
MVAVEGCQSGIPQHWLAVSSFIVLLAMNPCSTLPWHLSHMPPEDLPSRKASIPIFRNKITKYLDNAASLPLVLIYLYLVRFMTEYAPDA